MYLLKSTATTLLALLLWIALVGYAALSGWFIDGLAKPGDARAFMNPAVALLQERNRGNAALVLIEDGKVDLDAPVNGYLTRWKLPTGDYDPREVTVRHLLSHTAGLTDGLGIGAGGCVAILIVALGLAWRRGRWVDPS